MRVLNTAAQALRARGLAGEKIPVVQLLELHLDVIWRLNTSGVSLTWGGYTWQGSGIAITAVQDDANEFVGLTFSLPGATQTQLALAFDEDVEGATVRVYDAWLDPDTAQVADAVLAWSGSLETPQIEDGPIATVAVQAEHRGAIAVRAKPSRYTNDEQQRLYPGDTCLNFDPATDAAPLTWPAASFFRK